MKFRHGMRITSACVTLCLSTLAWSQASPTQVTLSGALDTYAGRDQLAGRTAKYVVTPGGLTTSYWGIQAIEDLGDGLRAQAFLYGFLTPDTGASGRFPGDAMFSRRSTVGLAGAFGEVNLGRMNSPFFFTMVAFDPYAGAALGPMFQHTYPGGQPLTAPMVAGDSSFLNMLNYQSPVVSGFKVNLSLGLGEQSGNNGNNRFGSSLTYV